MKEKVTFSIIVVTYNRNQLLKNCLNSFKNQTFQDFEVIVVDRGSEPSAEAVVQSLQDERFYYVRSSQKIHFCDIVNEVVKKTAGKYLCVFGDDDIITSHGLELAKFAFEKNTDCDITILGSVSVINSKFDCLKIPSHFSVDTDFPYFREQVLTKKISGKEWLKWVLSVQFIGKKVKSGFPSFLHPSVCFIRKNDNFYKVCKRQGGIAVKPSFDSGYLGLAHFTNILYVNAPLVIITYINNVSNAGRRFWNNEIQDIKYLPKIANIENRGADSILNVLHLNNISDFYDTKIQTGLCRRIIKDIEKDSVWDIQSVKDYLSLFPFYLKTSKIKIDVLLHYIYSIASGIYIHCFQKQNTVKQKSEENCINAMQVSLGLEQIFKHQIDKIKESFY